MPKPTREEYHALNLEAHDWLLKQPHSKEREHVEDLLAEAVALKYDDVIEHTKTMSPRERITLARVVGYYLRKRVREQRKRAEKGNVFVPEPGKRDINLHMIETLTKLQQKLLAPPLVDSEVEAQAIREMAEDEG